MSRRFVRLDISLLRWARLWRRGNTTVGKDEEKKKKPKGIHKNSQCFGTIPSTIQSFPDTLGLIQMCKLKRSPINSRGGSQEPSQEEKEMAQTHIHYKPYDTFSQELECEQSLYK